MLQAAPGLLLRVSHGRIARSGRLGSRIIARRAAPMQLSPPELAAQRAGITLERAFAIDEVSLYERLGPQVLQQLAKEFYDRVYADEDQRFRDVFAASPKEAAIRNQWEFVAQRLGGPPLYSQRKGHPALPRRHMPHDCSQATAERWMHHMRGALAAVPEIDEDSARRLHDYFLHTCYFLVVVQEMRQDMQQQAAAAQQQQQRQAPAADKEAGGDSQGQEAARQGCPAHAQAAGLS